MNKYFTLMTSKRWSTLYEQVDALDAERTEETHATENRILFEQHTKNHSSLRIC